MADFIINHNKVAISFKDRQYTYEELINNIQYYQTLSKIDVGGRVLTISENRPEIAFSTFSTWQNKGIAITVDMNSSVEEIVYFLKDAKPQEVFTTNLLIEKVKKAIEISGVDCKLDNFDEIEVPKDYKGELDSIPEPPRDEVVIMLYTSGTTGDPKGVMLTAGNLLSNTEGFEEFKIYSKEDRFLGLLPYHHVLPLMANLMAPISCGAEVVMLDDISADAIKSALQKHKITFFVAVPRLWEMFHKEIMKQINSKGAAKKLFKLAEKLQKPAFSKKVFKKVHDTFGGHINVLISGGAKLDPQIYKDFTTLGFNVLEGYGLTETSPVIAVNKPDDSREGACGTILPKVECRIADDGEVIVRGPNVMKGYYNKPEATAEVIDSDGWFHTGDLGELKDGYLYLKGRKKEMIVLSNGKNINPADIEKELMKQGDLIQEIAVTEHNNHLVAIIQPNFQELKNRGVTNIAETLKWEVLDPYNIDAPNYRKVLDLKVIQEELPKTRLGKLRRFKLKELLVEERKEVEHLPDPNTEEYRVLKNYLVESTGKEISPRAHLELDLGLDSLDTVQLLSFIESSFGVKVNEEELTENSTVEKLAEFLGEKATNITEQKIDWKEILNKDIEIKKSRTSNAIKALRVILMPVFSFYLKRERKGLKYIPEEPCILIGNHQSFIDVPLVNNVMDSKILNKTYYMATSKFFESGPLKPFADHSNILVVDLNKNITETLQAAAKVLREGNNVLIFPEGARTRDGELAKFKKAFAILSKNLNIPISPFAIDGAYESLPTGASFPKPGNVKIEFFKKIDPKDLTVEEIVEKSEKLIGDWLKENKEETLLK